MNTNSSNKIFNNDILPLSLSMGLAFSIISTFALYMYIGYLVFNVSIALIFMTTIMLALFLYSIYLLSVSFNSSKIQKIVFFALLSPLFFISFNYKNIQTNAINSAYNSVQESMLNSYSGISTTTMYKTFLIDKENRDLKALEMYRNNMDNYLSITSEQSMNLKLFYTSVNNREMRAKLDSIFEDNLITKSEFVEFQNFVYNLKLTPQEASMMALVSK